jgi:hypothetical protein
MNITQHSIEIEPAGRSDVYPRSDFERPKTRQYAKAGQDVRVGRPAIQVSGMSFPLQEPLGRDFRLADAMNMDNVVREFREPCCWST